MPSLRLSEQQVAELSDDMVRRHALDLNRRTGQRVAADRQPPAAGLPAAAPQLKALHAELRAQLQQKAGGAAPHLVVDLDHTARQLLRALQAGAGYREPAAAALMTAAAALGALWLGDDRLCIDGEQSVPPLAEPVEATALRDWAEASWAERHRFASRRAHALQLPVRYALAHAVESGGFDSQTLRSIADAVFDASQQDSLRRFLGAERALIAAAGLDAQTIGDRQVEAVCLAGDLAFGLGRFVRIAVAARSAGQAASADALTDHLREALDALAD
ncbi:hypothetical protein [Piscinibacter sakaiensis]|uniref:hypothetical protein n=1 Tax=Piscinibacter sakaiensis TaxID=1547922 RepID=UPI003AAC7998